MILPLKRFFSKIRSRRVLAPSMAAPGIYLDRCVPEPKRVLFCFDDPGKFHLGDHFFIEPLVRLFRDNGMDVEVAPLEPMAFYFRYSGLNVVRNPACTGYDLIVTRIEFHDRFRDKGIPLLVLDTTDYRIDRPICNYLIEQVASALHLDESNTSAKPTAPELPFPTHLIDSKTEYLVFNPYLVSSSFLVRRKHLRQLAEYARNIAEEQGLKVILTGSRRDLEQDRQPYAFVDVDLRGKTSVEELFALSGAPNVRANVSFDALGMHLFLLYNKPSYILFRGRFLRRNAAYILKYVNPPFECTEEERRQQITYIGSFDASMA